MNDNDNLCPEKWATHANQILHERLVLGNLIQRDAEEYVARFGDVVNIPGPAGNIRVTLNMQHYDRFVIKDGELSRPFDTLLQTHIEPAMRSLARGIDRAIGAELLLALLPDDDQRVGRLGDVSPKNVGKLIKEAARTLKARQTPVDDRSLLVSPEFHATLLKSGESLEDGRIEGFNAWMSQEMPAVRHLDCDVVFGIIHHKMLAGDFRQQSCVVPSYAVTAGEFAVVTGNDQPVVVTDTKVATGKIGTGSTVALTFHEANKYDTRARAAVAIYKKCKVRGKYSADHPGEIIVEGYSPGKEPRIGQLLAFGRGERRHTYVVIEAWPKAEGQTCVLLSRPLDKSIDDNDAAYPGPAGGLNLALHKNAAALVSRPLAEPPFQFGVTSCVVLYEKLWLRVTMQYDAREGGMAVQIDALTGLALLDPSLATVVLG